jgi:hypothetical protein
LSELDGRIASYELRTSLQDSFLGQAYTYDDTGQSEGWMKSMLYETDEQNEKQKAASALACDDGVIKAQVQASMQTLLIAVQDRVMTETGVLEQLELRSSNWESTQKENGGCGMLSSVEYPEVVEQEVWGIDCYTHRNISICLETELDSDTALVFLEKWLLPAINACPVDRASNIANAARILEGLPFEVESEPDTGTNIDQWRSTLLGKALISKIKTSGPTWLQAAAYLLRRACEALGLDYFRVHPKGHGSIVLTPKLPPNKLVTFYRGEVYPSWRWGEKMDAIEITQRRKGLKPGLPDFFNMVLERPQMDPRGYGLLFVDASRKAGHGSMLSHSCQPSCEVRVAAKNGVLTLALSTLREMSVGEELTFDYNAVTESVNEYHHAVCLCGHGRCRGSFLHFATADCYQQVLNRNSPIAVRLSNLIKGCMKQVMAEDDERILNRHGFHTAAFGAISVNRRKANKHNTASLDSIDIVPIWLRTFVADTLRYIEYERRALPIALICNELFKEDVATAKPSSLTAKTEPKLVERKSSAKVNVEGVSKSVDEVIPAGSKHKYDKKASKEDKPIKGSKPEPTFFFYARANREEFVSRLMEERDETEKALIGIDLKREIQKFASKQWNELDAEKKSYWKEEAILDWEKNGGREKARLEEERLKVNGGLSLSHADKATQKSESKATSKVEPKQLGSTSKADFKKSDTKKVDSKNGVKTGHGKAKQEAKDDTERLKESSKISFEAADTEGVTAMEQRIQQLTQTLSRVGRVLDRHREKAIPRLFKTANIKQTLNSPEALRALVDSPLKILPDEHIVAWMWNHDQGIVRVLLRQMQTEVCVSPALKESILATESKYSTLAEFGDPWEAGHARKQEYPMTPYEGRKQLTGALLEFRANLLDGMREMANDIKTRKASVRTRKKKNQIVQAKMQEASDTEVIIKSLMDELIDTVVTRVSENPLEKSALSTPISPPDSHLARVTPEMDEPVLELDPWLENFNKRFKLQKAADLLLIYARTSTFFSLQPYEPLESSPIEVYARELGNAVPSSVIDEVKRPGTESLKGVSSECLPVVSENHDSFGDDNNDEEDDKSHSTCNEVGMVVRKAKRGRAVLCQPDDIITEVVVKYQGDYVLSQLLQWFNYGIGQKPGLPDMLGCILLPSMSGCWTLDTTQTTSSKTDKRTRYQTHTQQCLIEWFKDPIQRGSPWPDELRKAFVDKNEADIISDASSLWLPFGSPVMDFLVTGEDFNITSILLELGSLDWTAVDSAGSGLLSTVDHGRPAQAVSNWVQCENPKCLKWRKVPWHVDVDTLSEKFYCKENIWNPASASCDAPEDDWDESTDAQVGADGSAYNAAPAPKAQEKKDERKKPKERKKSNVKLEDFTVGGKLWIKGRRSKPVSRGIRLLPSNSPLAKFDVLRRGKEKWCTGVVVELDLEGDSKSVKFHFPKVHLRFDEWIEATSPRLAPLHSTSLSLGATSEVISSTHSKTQSTEKQATAPMGKETSNKKARGLSASTSQGDVGSGGAISSFLEGKPKKKLTRTEPKIAKSRETLQMNPKKTSASFKPAPHLSTKGELSSNIEYADGSGDNYNGADASDKDRLDGRVPRKGFSPKKLTFPVLETEPGRNSELHHGNLAEICSSAPVKNLTVPRKACSNKNPPSQALETLPTKNGINLEHDRGHQEEFPSVTAPVKDIDPSRIPRKSNSSLKQPYESPSLRKMDRGPKIDPRGATELPGWGHDNSRQPSPARQIPVRESKHHGINGLREEKSSPPTRPSAHELSSRIVDRGQDFRSQGYEAEKSRYSQEMTARDQNMGRRNRAHQSPPRHRNSQESPSGSMDSGLIVEHGSPARQSYARVSSYRAMDRERSRSRSPLPSHRYSGESSSRYRQDDEAYYSPSSQRYSQYEASHRNEDDGYGEPRYTSSSRNAYSRDGSLRHMDDRRSKHSSPPGRTNSDEHSQGRRFRVREESQFSMRRPIAMSESIDQRRYGDSYDRDYRTRPSQKDMNGDCAPRQLSLGRPSPPVASPPAAASNRVPRWGPRHAHGSQDQGYHQGDRARDDFHGTTVSEGFFRGDIAKRFEPPADVKR